MAIIMTAPAPAVHLSVVNEQRLRILFFGTPQFAVPSLRLLHKEGWPIVGVVTAPDKPVGRDKVLTPSPVKTVAQEIGLDVYTPASLKDEDFWTTFTNLKPDLCIVVAYGKLIGQRYLSSTRLGFLNIHPSLLPSYRGSSPIASAILDGTTETGVSIMLLDAQMDHGPILAAKPWHIPTSFDTPLCEDELARVGAQLLIDTLPSYIHGELVPQPQDETHATFTKKFTREDGRIDWTASAPSILNQIRALGANPGTWTTWNGKTLNIFQGHVATPPTPSQAVGTVMLHDKQLLVSTGDGALALELLQLEGSKRQGVKDFLNGHPGIANGMLI
jgi:methionyl-tRNA formyltransferase